MKHSELHLYIMCGFFSLDTEKSITNSVWEGWYIYKGLRFGIREELPKTNEFPSRGRAGTQWPLRASRILSTPHGRTWAFLLKKKKGIQRHRADAQNEKKGLVAFAKYDRKYCQPPYKMYLFFGLVYCY